MHPAQKMSAFRHRFRAIAEQMGDFGRVMDMPFRIRLQQASCPGDGGAFANAAQHVLKGTLRRAGIERVHGPQQGTARYRRKPLELRQPLLHNLTPTLATRKGDDFQLSWYRSYGRSSRLPAEIIGSAAIRARVCTNL